MNISSSLTYEILEDKWHHVFYKTLPWEVQEDLDTQVNTTEKPGAC